MAAVDARVVEERRDAEVARVAVRDGDLRVVEEELARRGLDEPDRGEEAGERDGLDREHAREPVPEGRVRDDREEGGEREDEEGDALLGGCRVVRPEERHDRERGERGRRHRERAGERRKLGAAQAPPGERRPGGREDDVERKEPPEPAGLAEADEEPVVRAELEGQPKRGDRDDDRRDERRPADEDAPRARRARAARRRARGRLPSTRAARRGRRARGRDPSATSAAPRARTPAASATRGRPTSASTAPSAPRSAAISVTERPPVRRGRGSARG